MTRICSDPHLNVAFLASSDAARVTRAPAPGCCSTNNFTPPDCCGIPLTSRWAILENCGLPTRFTHRLFWRPRWAKFNVRCKWLAASISVHRSWNKASLNCSYAQHACGCLFASTGTTHFDTSPETLKCHGRIVRKFDWRYLLVWETQFTHFRRQGIFICKVKSEILQVRRSRGVCGTKAALVLTLPAPAPATTYWGTISSDVRCKAQNKPIANDVITVRVVAPAQSLRGGVWTARGPI